MLIDPPDKKIVLKHSYPGLGDNLCHSTLPEIYTNMGYEVWVSSSQAFRNKGVEDLIMMNPFIKGFTDEQENLNIDSIFKTHYPIHYPNKNYTARLEYMLFGQEFNQYPKIYYEPKFLPEWQDKIFVDFNSASTQHNTEPFLKLAEENYENFIQVEKDYPIRDIFEYIDIIYSSKRFLCTYSGSMVLASAINKRNVDCYIPESWVIGVIVSGGYCFHYHNVNYVSVDNIQNSLWNT